MLLDFDVMIGLQRGFFIHHYPQHHFHSVNKSEVNEAVIISYALVYNV